MINLLIYLTKSEMFRKHKLHEKVAAIIFIEASMVKEGRYTTDPPPPPSEWAELYFQMIRKQWLHKTNLFVLFRPQKVGRLAEDLLLVLELLFKDRNSHAQLVDYLFLLMVLRVCRERILQIMW